MAVSLAGLDFADPGLEAGIRRGLADVETLLRASVRSDYPFVDEASRHLLVAGGKRYRPLITLLAAHAAGDPAGEGVVPAAVAIELTHLSTLYHDDVMDEATLRRGAEAANHRWGNTIAILTGDFLFARASEITADLGTAATRILARTIAVLCEGQIRETVGPADGDDLLAHYLRVVTEKTGSLIATAARLGATFGGGAPETVDLITRYADRFGVAFQLSDDILDVSSGSSVLGKEQGTDLRERIFSLPVVLAAKVDPDVYALVRGDLSSERSLAAALEALRASTAMEEARAMTVRWAEEARAVLGPLPEGPPKAALSALCDLVVSRTS
ncbi:MAG TPA: polyprenyl synthetase family protein [Mycobacteriales bacterium]|jgi:heptaprenyl diphosphate synthase|nr:polyprenyl synthetase family protein [Mycobacteriales bacterium]